MTAHAVASLLVMVAVAAAGPLLRPNNSMQPTAPSAAAKETARRVLDALENTRGVHEAAAHRLFAALRAGQDPARPRVQGLEDDIREAEANSTLLLQVGEELLGQLYWILQNPTPGAIDQFTGYIWDTQNTRLCMAPLWWGLAKQQLQSSRVVGTTELQDFRQVVYYVQPCS